MNNEPLEPEPMNNEPLEREPIDRMRARLEALLKANAAPRCGARSKTDGQALPGCGHAERALQASRWQEHGAAHDGGPRAQQAGKLETWALFAGSQGGTVAPAGGNACGPVSARLDLRPRRSRGRIRTTPDHLSRRTDWHR